MDYMSASRNFEHYILFVVEFLLEKSNFRILGIQKFLANPLCSKSMNSRKETNYGEFSIHETCAKINLTHFA